MMKTLQHNFAYILASFLAFLVLSSKNILIYNEEILIALSFLGFVLFSSHTLSESIQEAFQARRAAIQQELQTYLEMKESLIQSLLKEYTQQLAMAESLQVLGHISCGEIQYLQEQREQALQQALSLQIQQKLKAFLQIEKSSQDLLQQALVKGFQESVLEEFQNSKQDLGAKLVQQAIQTLKASKSLHA